VSRCRQVPARQLENQHALRLEHTEEFLDVGFA
jgi:hypothetical protein